MSQENGVVRSGTVIHVTDPELASKIVFLAAEKGATRAAIGRAIVKAGIAAVEQRRGGPIPSHNRKRSSLIQEVEL